MQKRIFLPIFIVLTATAFLSCTSDEIPVNEESDPIVACSYDFNVSTGTYQDLTNSSSLNNGMVWDDPSYAVPIGFDFEICKNTYQTIYFSNFGNGGTLGSGQNSSLNLSLIAPIIQDIADLGHISGTSRSPLSYKTVGTVGNRILKIEWKNVGFWGSPVDYINFQVWFYESDNSIAYHYGPSSVANPVAAFEGETGPVVLFFPLVNMSTETLVEPGYALVGNPADPTVIGSDDTNPPTPSSSALNGMIPAGTIYTFTPTNHSIANH